MSSIKWFESPTLFLFLAIEYQIFRIIPKQVVIIIIIISLLKLWN